MKVSAQAAEQASTNGNSKPDSPALAQLKAAIEPDQVVTGDGSNSMADGVAETAVLEAGEDDAGEDEEFAGIGQPGLKPGEIALVGVYEEDDDGNRVVSVGEAIEMIDGKPIPPANVSQTTAGVSQPAPIVSAAALAAVPAAPAPYDPIAEVDEEIAENNERIVAHAIRASELDTMLKATKKSLKTAADEGVELAVRRAGLLLQQKEKVEREAAAASKPERPAQPALDAVLKPADDSALNATPEQIAAHVMPQAADGAPESTEEFHTRIAEQFAPRTPLPRLPMPLPRPPRAPRPAVAPSTSTTSNTASQHQPQDQDEKGNHNES